MDAVGRPSYTRGARTIRSTARGPDHATRDRSRVDSPSRKSVSPENPTMPRQSIRTRERLALRNSGIHGRGVFARVPIPAGTRLVEYVGERINQEEGDQRYPWDSSVPYHTMLFTVEDDLLVDGGVRGNISKYINHSCDPNCTSVIEDRRIYIDAIRDIEPGEELTFDYRLIVQGRHKLAVLKRRYPCHCGARGCRGTMVAR